VDLYRTLWIKNAFTRQKTWFLSFLEMLPSQCLHLGSLRVSRFQVVQQGIAQVTQDLVQWMDEWMDG
jgi:hypothetical protein